MHCAFNKVKKKKHNIYRYFNWYHLIKQILSVYLQIEQQEQVLSQLQQELNMERSRHQETSSSLTTSKKSVASLQDEMDALQKKERDANNTVSVLCGWYGVKKGI